LISLPNKHRPPSPHSPTPASPLHTLLPFHRRMSAAARTPASTRGRAEEDEPVPDHLLCPVCLDAPPNHVYQCRDGHLLCSGCLDELRAIAGGQTPKCPTCRTELPDELIRNRAVEQPIALLPATCRHCTEKRPVARWFPTIRAALQVLTSSARRTLRDASGWGTEPTAPRTRRGV
jgi:hypothetical protein